MSSLLLAIEGTKLSATLLVLLHILPNTSYAQLMRGTLCDLCEVHARIRRNRVARYLAIRYAYYFYYSRCRCFSFA